ncbi:MAG TPA: enoyl-CoA hydratase/isomerase family protein [Bryobacteraceae bacterium]|nr:enoyl-CoA hydratase/isomerase family protein [Bryobacteraceae bacterium]
METQTGAQVTRSDAVYLEKRGHIAELVLNRPAVLNAENWQMAHAFHAALDELEKTAEIRAVVVTGQGRSFSSGIDLRALAGGELDISWFRSFDEAMRRLEQLDALTVAKMRGYAIGGGLQIALACDLRIAAPDTKVGLPAVMEALIPGMGTYRLPRFIGLGRARRLVLTGELMGAEEALRIGLLDWVVPEEKLDETVDSVIAGVLKGSPTAQAFSKKLVTAAFERDFDSAFSEYLDYQQQSLRSSDHEKAMAEYRNRKK